LTRYIVKRLLLAVPTLFLVTVLIFMLLRVLPGDPADLILSGGGDAGGGSRATPEEVAALRSKLGTDRPLPIQYVTWIGGLFKLDAGESFVTGRPVLAEVAGRVPVSAQLALMAAAISTLVAVPLGVIAAARRNTPYDYAARIVSIIGMTAPIFWTGTLVILGLSFAFRWVPPVSYAELWENPLENLQQMIWPALVMGFYHTTILSRMTRASVLAVLGEDYIRTARAKGLREGFVLRRHALRNALLPIITLAGLQFGALLGGVVILEQIFSVPGLGRLLVDAILKRDFPVVQATILFFAGAVVVTTLVVDLLYAWLDPRVSYT
jgi:peptide/nickel transport system permease protein